MEHQYSTLQSYCHFQNGHNGEAMTNVSPGALSDRSGFQSLKPCPILREEKASSLRELCISWIILRGSKRIFNLLNAWLKKKCWRWPPGRSHLVAVGVNGKLVAFPKDKQVNCVSDSCWVEDSQAPEKELAELGTYAASYKTPLSKWLISHDRKSALRRKCLPVFGNTVYIIQLLSLCHEIWK